jgi:hypothetical protein
MSPFAMLYSRRPLLPPNPSHRFSICLNRSIKASCQNGELQQSGYDRSGFRCVRRVKGFVAPAIYQSIYSTEAVVKLWHLMDGVFM